MALSLWGYHQLQIFLGPFLPRCILGLLEAASEIHLTPTGMVTAFSIRWNCFNEV